jgi:hypothetical protein
MADSVIDFIHFNCGGHACIFPSVCESGLLDIFDSVIRVRLNHLLFLFGAVILILSLSLLIILVDSGIIPRPYISIYVFIMAGLSLANNIDPEIRFLEKLIGVVPL